MDKFDVNAIGKIRRQLDLTQKELATLSGVSQSLIAKIESGKIDPAYSKVTQIFAALEGEQNKGKLHKLASDIMTKVIFSVAPSDQLSKALSLMRHHNISQIPVLENGRCVGSLSETVLLDVLAEGGSGVHGRKVGDIMKETLPSVPAHSVVDAAIHLLRYSSAVLVEQNGKIVGIITKADLFKVV